MRSRKSPADGCRPGKPQPDRIPTSQNLAVTCMAPESPSFDLISSEQSWEPADLELPGVAARPNAEMAFLGTRSGLKLRPPHLLRAIEILRASATVPLTAAQRPDATRKIGNPSMGLEKPPFPEGP